MPPNFEHVDFNGLPCVRLRGANGASALIALHGAQLLSWKTGHSSVGDAPADGRERLFLSERARFAEGAAIRGGVPVIFPQFAGRGPLPKHGFARTLPWRLIEGDEQAMNRYAGVQAKDDRGGHHLGARAAGRDEGVGLPLGL